MPHEDTAAITHLGAEAPRGQALMVDLHNKLAVRGGARMHLTRLTATLLHVLNTNLGRPVSRIKLFDVLWPSQHPAWPDRALHRLVTELAPSLAWFDMAIYHIPNRGLILVEEHYVAPTRRNTVNIEPTVGRIVWYYDYPGQEQPGAAIVTYVHSDGLVNLAVFEPHGGLQFRLSTRLIQEGEATPTAGNWCSWMPYQIGQAKRHVGDAAS